MDALSLTSLGQIDPDRTYTYADYLLWKFSERLELLRGKVLKMAAPSWQHQQVVTQLTRLMANYFAGDSCKVFAAPFDVRLPRNPADPAGKTYTVLQPDVVVLCDRTKLSKTGCVGAPDLVVEVLSPGNSVREMKQKFELYEEAGVREYWMVELAQRATYVYVLGEDGKFSARRPFTEDELIRSTIFDGLTADPQLIFPPHEEEEEEETVERI